MSFLYSNYSSKVFASSQGAVAGAKLESFKKEDAQFTFTITNEFVIATTPNPNLVVSFPQDPESLAPLAQGSTLVLRDVTTSRWQRVASPQSADEHSAVFIQSVHPLGYVVDVKWQDTADHAQVISWSKKNDTFSNQLWSFPDGVVTNSVVKSSLNNLVLTVVGTPARGAQIANSPVGADGPTANQLWNLTPHGFVQLASTPHLVLTLPVNAEGVPLPPVKGQEAVMILEDLSLSFWRRIPVTTPNLYYYQTLNPVGYVIDISNEVTGEKDPIIGWPQKPENESYNQLWVIQP